MNNNLLHILLVEDTQSDRLLVEVALNQAKIPYDLMTASRGDGVADFLEEKEAEGGKLPDVLLLDLELPGMNGFELLEVLSEMSPAIRALPIVILTNHVDFEYIQDNFPLCIIGYVNKPCSAAGMAAMLQKI